MTRHPVSAPEDPIKPPRAPLDSRQSARARDLRGAGKYLAGAVCVGFLELVDASLLAENDGNFSAFNDLVSFVELSWLIVSIGVLVRVKQPATKLVAHAFVAYAVIGMVVGGMIASPETVPVPVIVVGGVFGLGYAIASAYVGASRVWREKAAAP